jgi:hypothetical protein
MFKATCAGLSLAQVSLCIRLPNPTQAIIGLLPSWGVDVTDNHNHNHNQESLTENEIVDLIRALQNSQDDRVIVLRAKLEAMRAALAEFRERRNAFATRAARDCSGTIFQ